MKTAKGEEATKYWRIEDMEVGDYISTKVINKKGDRNLDGTIISGTITEIVKSHRYVKVDNGWGCHEKDELLEHRRRQP